MRLKPAPRIIFERPQDEIDHVLDGIVDGLKAAPKTVEAVAEKANSLPASLEGEQQAVLTYFAELMADFFAAVQTWAELPLPEAQQAYEDYVSALLPELSPKLKKRFAERADLYAKALFKARGNQEQITLQAENLASFNNLIENLSLAALAATALPDDEQAAVIALAYGDYHQALVAGVQAGFLTMPTAEFLAGELKQDLLIAGLEKAIAESDEPLLLALAIADGATGEGDVDALPEAIRRQFLEQLLSPKEKQYDQ